MKKYIQPSIKLQDLEAESLLEVISMYDEVGDGNQLSKDDIYGEFNHVSLWDE